MLEFFLRIPVSELLSVCRRMRYCGMCLPNSESVEQRNYMKIYWTTVYSQRKTILKIQHLFGGMHYDNALHLSFLIQIFRAKDGIPIVCQIFTLQYGSLWFLVVFEIEGANERIPYCDFRWYNAELDKAVENYFERSLPEVFPAREGMLG